MQLFIDRSWVNLEHVGDTSVLARDLETAVDCFAIQAKDESDMLDIVICSRYDCHLLDCRRPLVHVQSTFGVIEDAFQEESQDFESVNPLLGVTMFLGFPSRKKGPFPTPPHSEWNRKPYQKLEVSDKDSSNTLWVDLQNVSMELCSVSDCIHFLRSLLGTSHNASPWGYFQEYSQEHAYSMVVLVLKRGNSALLEKFRTTDASPSYFLHSISRLQLPVNNVQWWKQEGHRASLVEKSDATLLVYKKLPPRESYQITQPENRPDGCLWECYFRQAEDVDDDDDNDSKEIHIKERFRLVAPPYVNHEQDYPNLLFPLIQDMHIIREEALTIPQWTAWPERNHYSSNPNNPDAPTWTVFPLCHCFPAHEVANKKWIQTTSSFVPKTRELLERCLGSTLRTALFSRLNPETTLEAHTGWEDLANHVYRLHLPLVVPHGGLCGTWVDGVVETHEEGRPLCFDDSKVHRAFNYSKEDRIVLILDLARPSALPIGTATGGHTDELDDFINSVS